MHYFNISKFVCKEKCEFGRKMILFLFPVFCDCVRCLKQSRNLFLPRAYFLSDISWQWTCSKGWSRAESRYTDFGDTSSEHRNSRNLEEEKMFCTKIKNCHHFTSNYRCYLMWIQYHCICKFFILPFHNHCICLNLQIFLTPVCFWKLHPWLINGCFEL